VVLEHILEPDCHGELTEAFDSRGHESLADGIRFEDTASWETRRHEGKKTRQVGKLAATRARRHGTVGKLAATKSSVEAIDPVATSFQLVAMSPDRSEVFCRAIGR
jgi:hypothetical protein